MADDEGDDSYNGKVCRIPFILSHLIAKWFPIHVRIVCQDEEKEGSED